MKRQQALKYTWLALVVAAAGIVPGISSSARAAVAGKTAKSGRTGKTTGSSSSQTQDELTSDAALRKAQEIAALVDGDTRTVRLTHAKELLGKYYKRSIVARGERSGDPDPFILKRLEIAFKNLPQGQSTRVTDQVYKTILAESRKHEFDPIFLMAVIENESSFNLKVRGTSGEIGLMQLMPETGKWIAQKLGIPWRGEKTLEDPVTNIRLGAAYMALLREKFDSHSTLYLAAYNMGQGNVNRALAKEVWPKDYPIRVMQRYLRYYSELSQHRASAPKSSIN